MATNTGTSNTMRQVRTTTGTSGDIFRQIAVVAGFVGVIIGNGISEAAPINGKTSAQISNALPILITPANFAFAIWGVIWLGLAAYALYQALPAQRTNETLRRIAPWFILSCVCNVGWLVLFHYEQFIISCFVIGLLAVALARIYLIVGIGAKTVSNVERWTTHVPFSVYLGWITVATIVNITYTLYYHGIVPSFGVQEILTVALLVVATGIGAIFALRYHEIALIGVFVWAFYAIGAARGTDSALIPGDERSAVVQGAAFALAALLVVLVIAGQVMSARTNRPVVTGTRKIV
jgi:tryptophan-rich sensory protein